MNEHTPLNDGASGSAPVKADIKPFTPISASGLDIIHSAQRKKVLTLDDNQQRVVDSLEEDTVAYGMHSCPRQFMTGLCVSLGIRNDEHLLAEAMAELRDGNVANNAGFEGTGFGVTAEVESPTTSTKLKL